MPKIIVLEDPLSPEEHLDLGMAYEERGEYDLALKEYAAAADEFPQAHHFMGNVYFMLKDYPAAEKSYKKAIKEMPDNPDPYNNLAWMYYVQKINLDEAERLARKAVSLAPAEKIEPFRDTLEKIVEARKKE